MDSKETQQQQNRNAAAALAGHTSTSQAMHNRSSVGALSLRQPQPLQGVMPDGSPYSASVATQQPWRQVKRGRGRPRKYAPPDVNVNDGGDRGGGAKTPSFFLFLIPFCDHCLQLMSVCVQEEKKDRLQLMSLTSMLER